MNRFEQLNLIIDSELTHNEKMLLLTIFRYYNHEKGYSYPSKNQIMKAMSLKNETSYYKAKKNLENNHILITKNVKGVGNQYIIDYESLTKCKHTDDKISDLQNESVSDLQSESTKRKEKIKEKKILEYIHSENNPNFEYISGQWMFELSSDFLC